MRIFAFLLVLSLLAAGESVLADKAKINEKTKQSASKKSAANPSPKAPNATSKPSTDTANLGSSGRGNGTTVAFSGYAVSKIKQTTTNSLADGYTSLVVDATGFKLGRSMCPKILRADGTEVWGTLKNLKDEDYDFLEEHGMVAYVTTLKEAYANDRCGTRPLVVKAIRTDTRDYSSVIVSDEDARRILEENKKSVFLEKFKVIFIKRDNPSSVAPSDNSNHQDPPAFSQTAPSNP